MLYGDGRRLAGLILMTTLAAMALSGFNYCAEDAQEKKMDKPSLTLGMVQINVTDLRKAKEFFGKTLGIKVKESLGEDAPFELDLGGATKVLVYQVPKAVKLDYPNQTGVSLVFHTKDLEATVKEWKAKGVEFIKIEWSKEESGIAQCPLGRFIAFKDPFGNVFELLQPK